MKLPQRKEGRIEEKGERAGKKRKTGSQVANNFWQLLYCRCNVLFRMLVLWKEVGVQERGQVPFLATMVSTLIARLFGRISKGIPLQLMQIRIKLEQGERVEQLLLCCFFNYQYCSAGSKSEKNKIISQLIRTHRCADIMSYTRFRADMHPLRCNAIYTYMVGAEE